MSETDNTSGLAIARRRWRNMMIAAFASGDVPKEQRKHLESMRKKLHIPLSEANAILQQHKDGNIQLFGTMEQRFTVFRDVLTMVLADHVIHKKEKKLIIALAKKLDINEDELDLHIDECRQALADENEDDSHRVSQRIFNRVSSTRILKEGDSTEDLHLSLLEKLAEEDAPAPVKDDRLERTQQEDMAVIEVLKKNGDLNDAQITPFMDRQKDEYTKHGRTCSILTLMTQANALDLKQVQKIRQQIRTEAGTWPPKGKKIKSDDEQLTIGYYKDSLDQTFDIAIVKPVGQIDHNNSNVLSDAFSDIFENICKLVVLDLSKVDYMSSGAIGVIIEYHAKARESWGNVCFVGLKPEVADVMKLLGVDTMINSADSILDAMSSFSQFAGIEPR